MGYSLSEIPYIGLAEKLGVRSTGPARIRQLNQNSDAPPRKSASTPGKVRQVSGYINEKNACSACYAGLVFALSRMENRERERLGQVNIGQGFCGLKAGGLKSGGLKGGGAKTGNMLGVGKCTAGLGSFCPGCPPTGAEILSYLRKQLRS